MRTCTGQRKLLSCELSVKLLPPVDTRLRFLHSATRSKHSGPHSTVRSAASGLMAAGTRAGKSSWFVESREHRQDKAEDQRQAGDSWHRLVGEQRHYQEEAREDVEFHEKGLVVMFAQQPLSHRSICSAKKCVTRTSCTTLPLQVGQCTLFWTRTGTVNVVGAGSAIIIFSALMMAVAPVPDSSPSVLRR